MRRLLDLLLLALPAQLHRVPLGRELGYLLLELPEPLDRGGIRFLGEGLTLDGQLEEPPLELVELGGLALDLHLDAARGLVDEVDRLVGQEAARDVAVGEGRGRDEGLVLYAHAVVDLVALLEAAQDRDRRLHGGLGAEHGLEAPLEGGVLLDVLAVLVESRRADAAQLASGESGLEEVGGVHRALGGSRADQGVELVDEEEHPTLGLDDLLDDGLEPLLELAAELRAGDEGAEVEGEELLALEGVRHVPRDDSAREALDDRRLADPGLAYEDRVVLGASGEDLHHAADLLVAADHRIELLGAGEGREVAAVALEDSVLLLGILVGDAPVASHGLEGREDGGLGDPQRAEALGRSRLRPPRCRGGCARRRRTRPSRPRLRPRPSPPRWTHRAKDRAGSLRRRPWASWRERTRSPPR